LTQTRQPAESRGIWPPQALNFLMADMQVGIGPFLGVFLLAHDWQSGLIGTGRVNVGQAAVMTVQGPGASLSPAIGGGSRTKSAIPRCS
jgi:hypothetical protein